MELEEKLNELLEKEGEVRGEVILSHLEYIKRKQSQEGINRLQKTFDELDYSIDPDKIKGMEWVKTSLSITILLLAKSLFDWSNKDIVVMGEFAPKYLMINRFFLNDLNSPERLTSIINEYWKKVSKVGTMDVADSGDGFAKINLSSYEFHPVGCLFIAGYIKSVFSLTVKNKVSIKETKCIHRGDNVHQFLVEWKNKEDD